MRLIDQLQKAVAAGGVAPPADDVLASRCPNLWEMITTDRWGDDSERMLPEIAIERVPGGYKVTLKDHALCIRKSALCLALDECWGALERALTDSSTPWESFTSYRNRKGPKVPEEKSSGRKKRK